jgi:hypothetical protein
MGLCAPARCGCGIRSSTLTVKGSGNEGDPFIIDGTNPPVYPESALPGSGVRFPGMVVSTSDTMRLLRWSGTVWTVLSEPPQSWTPLLVQSVTVPITIQAAWYRRSNGYLYLHLVITANGLGTASQNVIVAGIPFPFLTVNDLMGYFVYFDPGNTNYVGTVTAQTPTSFGLVAANTNNLLGPYGAHQVASGDVIRVVIEGRMA